MWTLVDLTAFVGGFAACWFSKDRISQAVRGTEAFAKTLETKAKALETKAKTLETKASALKAKAAGLKAAL